jgi:hypothetical protein
VKLAVRDDLISRLARIGKAGPLPKNLDKETAGLLDQMQRQIGTLQDGLRSALGDGFNGSQLGEGYKFAIDARAGTDGYNVLTTTEATAEGLPAEDGYVVYRHATGLLLNRYILTSWALNNPTIAAGILTSAGAVRVHSYDNQRTILQLDGDAISQEAVATLSFYPSQPVPVGFTGRPAGSVPATGKSGQVYMAAEVSALDLP